VEAAAGDPLPTPATGIRPASPLAAVGSQTGNRLQREASGCGETDRPNQDHRCTISRRGRGRH